MTMQWAFFFTKTLIAVVLFIQATEIFYILKQPSFKEIYKLNNIKNDFLLGLPIPNKWIFFIFAEDRFKYFVVLQISMAVLGLFQDQFIIFLILFFTHLMICIRFRGTFNGGSDMMTFVVITGVLIYLSSSRVEVQKLGLVYIAIQNIYSYFKAGIVKIIHAEWRSGYALPNFLKRSLFTSMRGLGERVVLYKRTCWFACWCVLIFELLSLLLPLFPRFVFIYFFFAILFHLIVYCAFGLNRFFWVWLSSWPATLYVLSRGLSL